MYFKQIILAVIFCVKYSRSADILGIVPTPSYSHQIAFTQLWRELSLRGHNVTVITSDPVHDPKLTNLTEIDMKWTYKYFKDISKLAEKNFSRWNILNGNGWKLFYDVAEGFITHPPVQELIHSKRNFDVVLVELIFPEFLAIAELYNCSKILISSFESFSYIHRAVGNPSHPVLHPEMITPFFGKLNFIERVESTLIDIFFFIVNVYNVFPTREMFIKNHFNKSLSLNKLLSDADMLFINTNPIIQDARAFGPTTITIGGNRNDVPPKLLPKNLKDFLDSAEEGFIYFSLGSNVKSKELNKDTLNTIIETLTEVPYKVLWKFEDDHLPGRPNNVKIVKWAPQQSVLSHPNIKLFITQGGLQSMEEALYREVPLVVIPFFGDQEHNAKLMESKGIARIVGRKPLKKKELEGAIEEVIKNPSYKNAVIRLKKLALDTPMTGLEKAVWWTEYVIRNKGAKHLRNPAADIPFYQNYLIDVIGFLLLVLCFVIVVVVYVARKIHKLIISILLDSTEIKDKKEN